MAHLYILLEQPELPTQVVVWDAQTMTVGRSNEVDLTLDDDEVSRTHAMISQDANGFEVADYRTGNGTYVNGERIERATPFLPGTVIQIGKAQLTLHQGDDHPATLGHKLIYLSQLKTVGRMPAGADGNATVLGLGDELPLEEFVVEPMRSTGEVAFQGSEQPGILEFGAAADELADCFDDDPMAMASNLELEDNAIDLLDDVLEVVAPPPERPLPQRSAPTPAPPQATPAAAAPAVAPAPAAAPADTSGQTGGDPLDRMRRLKLMLDEGLISEEEFQTTRARILQEI